MQEWNWPSTGHPPKWRRQKSSDESRLGTNTIPFTGEIPRCCHETLLQLQPKSKIARSATEFRPVPKIKLKYIIYKMFAYLVLDRIEQPLKSALLHLQPICCKQHDYIEGRLLIAPRGFCPKRITPSLAFRLKFFDGMGFSVDSFVAGHRKIHVSDLRQLDVHCYKLFRRVVIGAQPSWTGRTALLLPGSTEWKKPLGCTTNI